MLWRGEGRSYLYFAVLGRGEGEGGSFVSFAVLGRSEGRSFVSLRCLGELRVRESVMHFCCVVER